MKALKLVAEWPVRTVAAALVAPDGAVSTTGPTEHSFRLASITKMLVGWAMLVACEEGTLHLDQPVGQEGCTLRHLLAHAGGYAFDGSEPIARPGVRRIYSNTGIELAAAALTTAAEMPFADYLHVRYSRHWACRPRCCAVRRLMAHTAQSAISFGSSANCKNRD